MNMNGMGGMNMNGMGGMNMNGMGGMNMNGGMGGMGGPSGYGMGLKGSYGMYCTGTVCQPHTCFKIERLRFALPQYRTPYLQTCVCSTGKCGKSSSVSRGVIRK
eukprot:00744_1